VSVAATFFFCTETWTQGFHLESLHQPYFCEGFFLIGSHGTIFPGWLQTAIFLISASWEARITGMNHQHPAAAATFWMQFANSEELAQIRRLTLDQSVVVKGMSVKLINMAHMITLWTVGSGVISRRGPTNKENGKCPPFVCPTHPHHFLYIWFQKCPLLLL
jgi:hypothetical protein